MVVAYLSRLGRNVGEQLRVWDRVQAVGGEVVSIREGIDTTTAAGRLHRNLLISIDAHEREQHAERFEERRRLATEAGIWQRRQTPTGYRKDPETRRLVPDHPERVREAFDAAVAGDRITAIAERLGMTPGGARYLLRNRVYLGELRVGAHVNPDAHPALIDVPTFEAVQARMESGVRPARSNRPVALLAGLVRCSACGHVMTRGNSKGAEVYSCPTLHSGARCPRPAVIGCGRLDPHVEVIALAELENVRAAAKAGDRAGEVRAEIADERRDLDGLLDTFGEDVNAEALQRAAAKRSVRIEALEAELRTELGRVRGIPTAKRASEVWVELDAHERNALLRGLLAAVVVRAAGRGRKVPVAERAIVLRYGTALALPTRAVGGLFPIPFDPHGPDVLRVPAAKDGL